MWRRFLRTSPRRWPTAWQAFSKTTARSLNKSGQTSSSSSITACSRNLIFTKRLISLHSLPMLTVSNTLMKSIRNSSRTIKPTRRVTLFIFMPAIKSSNSHTLRRQRQRVITCSSWTVSSMLQWFQCLSRSLKRRVSCVWMATWLVAWFRRKTRR